MNVAVILKYGLNGNVKITSTRIYYPSIYLGIKYTSFPIRNDGSDKLFLKIGLQASDWILKCKIRIILFMTES